MFRISFLVLLARENVVNMCFASFVERMRGGVPGGAGERFQQYAYIYMVLTYSRV